MRRGQKGGYDSSTLRLQIMSHNFDYVMLWHFIERDTTLAANLANESSHRLEPGQELLDCWP